MSVFDIATPAGGDPAGQGDDRIRELKVALQEALRGQDTEGDEAIFPGTAPSTAPVYRYRGLKGTTGARPASGQYGFFFDSTRNVLQRDSGSAWEDVGTVIPAGTVMVFYQAAAPTGWTKVVTQNDKALRVVSGTGGGSGGATGLSAGITHVVNAHSHPFSHTHTVSLTSGTPSATANVDAGVNATIPSATHTHSVSGATGEPSTGNTSTASDNGTDTVTLAYIDVLLCSKD